jgi:molybdopterin-biosynthesis enzyme MoeA-like protein
MDIPSALIVGDYICLANECIIPGIPSDLHEVLAERVSARIQRALGDTAGLQATMQKVGEMETNQAKLIDNRTEGTPQKVLGRHTMLNIMARRRSHLRGW